MDYEARHEEATEDPTDTEAPIVALVQVIEAMAWQYGDDLELREGIAKLISGAAILIGRSVYLGRLSREMLKTSLDACAFTICFDRDGKVFYSDHNESADAWRAFARETNGTHFL